MTKYCESRDQVNEPAFNYVALVCMGLVHCQSKPKEKAEALFNILQEVDSEGNTATQISAQDKDWKPVMDTLFNLVSINAIEASQCNSYEQDDQVDLQENFDSVSGWEEAGDGETTVIDGIFSVCSRVGYEVFIEQAISQTRWVFNANTLRKRIWKEAGV